MTKPIQAINRYKADLRELQFLLFEQFELQKLLGKAPFEAWGDGGVPGDPDRVLPLGARGHRPAQRHRATTRAAGVEGGRVITPTGLQGRVEEALRGRVEADRGRRRVRRRRRAPRAAGAHRGDDLRRQHRVRHVLGPRVRRVRGHRVVRHPRAEDACTAARMFGGQWGGTMCLTEPQAGSDVGSAKTTAASRNAGRQLRHPRHEDLHLAAATTISPRTSSTSCSRASTAPPPAPRD